MAKIIAYDDEARQGMLAGLDKLADTTHPIYESNHEEERHVHAEPITEFLRGVTGWLHGKGLSTAGSGLHKMVQGGRIADRDHCCDAGVRIYQC